MFLFVIHSWQAGCISVSLNQLTAALYQYKHVLAIKL